MKKILYIAALAILVSSCDKKSTYESKTVETGQDSLSYSFGYFSAQQIVKDSILMDTLQMDAYLKGLITAMNEDSTILSEEVMTSKIQAFVKVIQEEMRAKQMAAQQQTAQQQPQSGGFGEAGEAFLAENGKKEGVTTLASGLQYEVLNEGTGTTNPSVGSTVSVHYTGSLINGDVFDSSVQRGEPATFPVNGVIRGWTEALQLMKIGDKWNIYLPYELAYGERGSGPKIPPFSALVFEVELLEIIAQ